MKTPSVHWLLPEPLVVPDALFQAAGNNPFLAELLFRRGIVDPQIVKGFLDSKSYKPSSTFEFPDIEIAIDILQQGIKNHSRIGVWGDFDVDGQTSTTILVSALSDAGADVVYHIPVRGAESHGISIPYLQKFLSQGVEILLSCDTGISAHDAVDFAHSKGVKVVITDHHQLPSSLPKADAIINPQRLPFGHPLGSLSGVGVAFKLLQAVFSGSGNFSEDGYLDLVALGLVADQATLKDDTRYLVQRGLEGLRHSERKAIQTMLALAEVNQCNLTEEHIGFILAPRLNAIGRLGDSNPVVDFLLSKHPTEIQGFATILEKLNRDRKALSDQIFKAALDQIDKSREIQDSSVIVLNHPAWPAGVVGIVASRLVDLYNRPVILLASPQGEHIKGSARSIEGIDITEAIASQKELLSSYGGHSMAAGLSLNPENLAIFSRNINKFVLQKLKKAPVEKELRVDAFLTLQDINLEQVRTIEELAPFGSGNSSPLLACQNLVVKSSTTIGKSMDHRKVIIEDQSGLQKEVLWWNGADLPLPNGLFDLAFSLRASDFKGKISAQMEWVDSQPVESASILIQPRLKYKVNDYRKAEDQVSCINEILIDRKCPNYFAGQPIPGITIDFSEAPTQTDQLAFITIPPGMEELQAIIAAHKPKEIFLFGLNPNPSDNLNSFLEVLAGLLKYALRHREGNISVQELAQKTAQRRNHDAL